MIKTEAFITVLQELAKFTKVLSHLARLAILEYFAETKTCISGEISDSLPLSRSTVSQHLKELRDLGLIHGEIEGLKVNYCLCNTEIYRFIKLFETFFEPIKNASIICETSKWKIHENIDSMYRQQLPKPDGSWLFTII